MNLDKQKEPEIFVKYLCFTAHVLFLDLNVFFARTTLPLAM